MNKLKLSASSAALVIGIASIGAANAQSLGGIDEIVVTARKKSESLQNVPIAVSALGEEALDQLGVDVFEDYLLQLPNVTAGGSGPGQSTIYIRGVASTTPNLTTAGVAGLSPNVALYLDEQPLGQPGRNLDVYAADMQRIEVLAGPQGTLFGASSQAGVVRLITNKPQIGEFSGKASMQVAFTPEGEMSNKLEGVVNIPVNDRTAVRAVVYSDNKGGYIDNVQGTQSLRDSARFRPEGTVRSNGVAVNADRKGKQAQDTVAATDTYLAGVTFDNADNGEHVEDDINDTSYNGFRISALHEVNDDDWSVNVGFAHQAVESDGVFFVDPELGDLKIQRYQADQIEDEFTNINWTVDGRLGALQALYTGAYTERTTDQVVDYTDYLFAGQYLPYYSCDASVSYPATGVLPSGTCYTPDSLVKSHTETTVMTHELRFATPEDNRLRSTFGAFYSDLVLQERNDFTYLGSENNNWAPNRSYNDGYLSDTGVWPAGVIFRNDIERTDEQFGIFGEATYDIVPDRFAVTLGARYYDVTVDMDGSANGSFYNLGAAEDQQRGGTNIAELFSGNGAGPDNAHSDGVITKMTATFTPEEGRMFYATYSEGFRAGLLNRPGGSLSADGTYVIPYEVETDEVTNYELGWKTTGLDGRLRFNGSAFFVEVEGLQTTIFDPAIVNLFFSDNAANAEIMGLEGDVTWLPESIEGLTVAGAFSMLDSEITEKLVPTNDVAVGDELAFAPAFQGNVRVRYEWMTESGMNAHIMPQVTFSDKSYSDIIRINRDEIDAWTMVSVRTGVSRDNWAAELYVDNLFDKRAEVARNYVNDRTRTTIARPLTIGLRFSQDF